MKILKITSILFLCIALFLYSLPLLFSTFGKNLFIHIIEKRLDANISIEKIHLSWSGPQQLENISIKNPYIGMHADHLAVKVSLFTLLNPQKIFIKKMIPLNASIKNANFTLYEKNKISASLYQIDGLLDLKEELNIQLSGKTKEQNIVGDFKITSNIVNERVKIDLSCEHFPTLGLDRILGYYYPDLKGLLINTIGELFEVKATATLHNYLGPIIIDLAANKAYAHLDATILENGLVLNKPFQSSFTLSAKLANYFMKDTNPLFLTALYAKKPIQLHIEKDGFFLPYPFNLKKLHISQAVLDMGQVRAQNGHTLSMIVGMMTKQYRDIHEMNIWFSPLYFQLQNGVIIADRMDMLVADSLHMCTWGKIDLIKDYVRMKLGLTAQSLESAFGIENLPSDYVMALPMKGPINDVQIDTSKATAKIAAMVAASHIKDHVDPIFGTVIDIIKAQDKDPNIPPPRRPFPWEGKVRVPHKKTPNILDLFQ